MTHTTKKVTAVLVVDAIEPVIPFWEKLGWANVAEVPHEDKIGFVILVKDGAEIMYQTAASVMADLPSFPKPTTSGTFLFIEVDDLDAVIKAVGKAPVLFERRKTFYGMDEMGFREPGGNAVTFAMKISE